MEKQVEFPPTLGLPVPCFPVLKGGEFDYVSFKGACSLMGFSLHCH